MSTVRITWQPVTLATDGETVPVPATYNLYQGTSAPALAMVQSGLLTNSATVAGLTPGATYYFAVSALDQGSEGAMSAAFSITIPLPLTYNDTEWDDEDPDDFFADDFGNDPLLVPAAPTGIVIVVQ